MNKKLIEEIKEIKDDYNVLNKRSNHNEFLVDMHVDAGKLLVKHIKFDLELTRKYIQAMSFLSWFKERKPIHSDKLNVEVMTTKYSDLTKYHTFHDYEDVKFTNIEDDTEAKITCSGTGSILWNSGSLSELVVPVADSIHIDNSNINSISIGDQTIKINHEKPKEVVKYEDTVSHVIEYPFNFDEGIVIAVYNYLKRMVEKDEEIEKYENKSESSKKANQKSVK